MKIDSTTRASGGAGIVETTTARSAILKQIVALQKIETGLSEQLAKLGDDFSATQQRVAIQQQIQQIDTQIAALQASMLQENADRAESVVKTPDEKVEQAPATPAAKPDKSTETVGSVIDTVA